MTAKEYLSRLQLMKSRIESLQEQRQVYLDRAGSMTASLNSVKVQNSIKHDKMEYSVVKAADLEKEIEESMFNLLVLKNKVINQIQGLSEVKHIDLLFKRYIQYQELRQISKEMNYTYQYVRELHGCALQEFSKVHAEILNEISFS